MHCRIEFIKQVFPMFLSPTGDLLLYLWDEEYLFCTYVETVLFRLSYVIFYYTSSESSLFDSMLLFTFIL